MNQIFKLICCGSVDDGKSTLIGRILLDSGNVKKDQLTDAKNASLRSGSKKTELSMLLDGLISEREQHITIDVAHRYFDFKDIRFHILDCPGHVQYTKNMAIAAAQADSALVVVDVTKGISEQTKKHIEICSLFKIKNICICLTKCDLITDSNKVLDSKRVNIVSNEIKEVLKQYAFNSEIIPISSITRFNMEKVFNWLYIAANKAKEDSKKIDKRVIHIQAAKIFNKERYYYGKEVGGNAFESNSNYTLYPAGIPVPIINTEIYGCFKVIGDIDISKGDCITNCKVNISNIVNHKTIWFSDKTDDMILLHGKRAVHVVNYDDSTIELDDDIIFNNIDDLKQNGFGILIDNPSKKTIACCIFCNN